MFAPKVEKAVSDAQQESQFGDFLDQHLLPVSDISHDSSKKLKIFIMVKCFSLHVFFNAKLKIYKCQPAITMTAFPKFNKNLDHFRLLTRAEISPKTNPQTHAVHVFPQLKVTV